MDTCSAKKEAYPSWIHDTTVRCSYWILVKQRHGPSLLVGSATDDEDDYILRSIKKVSFIESYNFIREITFANQRLYQRLLGMDNWYLLSDP